MFPKMWGKNDGISNKIWKHIYHQIFLLHSFLRISPLLLFIARISLVVASSFLSCVYIPVALALSNISSAIIHPWLYIFILSAHLYSPITGFLSTQCCIFIYLWREKQFTSNLPMTSPKLFLMPWSPSVYSWLFRSSGIALTLSNTCFTFTTP